MNLDRPIKFFDIEATGLDTNKDRIVQLAIVTMTPFGDVTSRFTWLFHPDIPIPPESTEVHGITDDDVKDCPEFASVAVEIMKRLDGSDLGGFNLINFDVPLLWTEFARAGLKWDLDGVRIFDVGNIFKKQEQRTLAAAVKFFCGREMSDAHDASVDTLATIDVFRAQLTRYPELGAMSSSDLAKFCKLDDRVDLAGLIVRNAECVPCYNTKRNRGVAVVDDVGYAQWMLRSDFPVQTKEVLTRILEEAHVN